jgi:hypothetical protein
MKIHFFIEDTTAFSHNIMEDGNAIRTNGERPRWITPYHKTSIYKSYVQVRKPVKLSANKL